jgi:hypothetical protein
MEIRSEEMVEWRSALSPHLLLHLEMSSPSFPEMREVMALVVQVLIPVELA